MVHSPVETTPVENDYVKIWTEDDILYLTYKKEHVDLPYAKSVVETRLKFSKGKSYPVFVDLNQVKGVNNEARAYLAGKEAATLISASALFGVNELIKMLANFYLVLNKPDVPVKFFNDKQKALTWLRNHS